jgi:hypothetical protein
MTRSAGISTVPSAGSGGGRPITDLEQAEANAAALLKPDVTDYKPDPSVWS